MSGVLLLRGQTIGGIAVPAGFVVLPLDADVAARLRQGGDGTAIDLTISTGEGGSGAAPATVVALSGFVEGGLLSALPGDGWQWTGGQWYRGSSAISGQTSSTYALALTTDAGQVFGFEPTGVPFRALIAIPGPTFPARQIFFEGRPFFFEGRNVVFS